jgi:hypothetical protein
MATVLLAVGRRVSALFSGRQQLDGWVGGMVDGEEAASLKFGDYWRGLILGIGHVQVGKGEFCLYCAVGWGREREEMFGREVGLDVFFFCGGR